MPVQPQLRAPGAALPDRVEKAVSTLEEWLAAEPFRAPDADELAELRLGPKELAAAVRAGRLVKIADGVAALGWEIPDESRDAVRKVLPPQFGIDGAGFISKRG